MQLVETAKESTGEDYGEETARLKLRLMLEKLELLEKQREELEGQMSRMARYNLVEDSSWKNKNGTKISKRGRKNLRNVLYQMAQIMVATNNEMKHSTIASKRGRKRPLKKM